MQLDLDMRGMYGSPAAVGATSSATWRPIHYLGSKRRAIPAIEDAIDEVAPGRGRVCDLFSGSGTVAAALAAKRPVVAVDIQEYSRVICTALFWGGSVDAQAVEVYAKEALRHSCVKEAFTPLIELEEDSIRRFSNGDGAPLCDLIEGGSFAVFEVENSARGHLRRALLETQQRTKALNVPLQQAVTARHFGGIYFSYRQAADLDVLLQVAAAHSGKARDVVLAAVLSTASDIVNTVGKHFAQPIRPRDKAGHPKDGSLRKVELDRRVEAFPVFMDWVRKYSALPVRQSSISVREDCEVFLSRSAEKFDVFYADPPYTRDHYSRFYHVLETMALGDDPEIARTPGKSSLSRGIYRADRHQSPFCIRSQAPRAFEFLFRMVADRGVPLVLSYSPYSATSDAHPRVMTVDGILHLARKQFRAVELRSVGKFAHSKLNHSRLHKDASKEAEVLLLCRP